MEDICSTDYYFRCGLCTAFRQPQDSGGDSGGVPTASVVRPQSHIGLRGTGFVYSRSDYHFSIAELRHAISRAAVQSGPGLCRGVGGRMCIGGLFLQRAADVCGDI